MNGTGKLRALMDQIIWNLFSVPKFASPHVDVVQQIINNSELFPSLQCSPRVPH